MKPIVGVRYECPTCPDFSLCSICEEKVDHHHNLLKIKKIVEKKEKALGHKGLGHCFRKIFGYEHHGHRTRSSSYSSERCDCKGTHLAIRKCWGLARMFGGSLDDYKSFVDENSHLKSREIFQKYADLQNLSEEDFRQRFIDMRCQKLSQSFGKPAQEFKSFVEDNYECRYGELVQMLEDQGEKSQRKWWKSKLYNFNHNCENKECRFKKEEIQVKPEKVEEPKKEEPKKDEISVVVNDSQLEEHKKESVETVREKRAILQSMQEIFGSEGSKEYFKFIDAHYKDGLEGVIQRWIGQLNSKVSK